MNAADIRRASVAKAFSLLTGGADFEVAAATARERATTRTWTGDGEHPTRDFIALMLDSELISKEVEDDNPSAAKILDRTWVTLAKKDGYDPSKPPAKGSASQANAVAIVAIVVGAVAVVGVLAYLIYRASQVVTAEIAIHASSQEMLRAHADAMTVIEAHHAAEQKAGHVIAYDAGELAVLAGLQKAQDNAAKANAGALDSANKPPPGPGATEGALLTLLVIGAGAVYLMTRK